MRMTRYLSSRKVGNDSSRLLNFIKVFPGESIRGIRGSVHIASLPGIGNVLKFAGPWSALEYNFYVMWVPDHVVNGYIGVAESGETKPYSGVPREPLSSNEWDSLWRRVVFEFGTDGNEFYGANPDGTGTSYDPVTNMYRRVRGDDPSARADIAAQDAGDQPIASDEPGTTLGPLGIQRLYSRESLLTPKSLPGLAASGGVPFAGLWDEFSGISDAVYGDTFDFEIPVFGQKGVVMIGVVRYEVSATTSFAQSFVNEAQVDTAAEIARNQALAMLQNGEMSAVQWQIQNGTSLTADYIRSILFGGDNYVESYGADLAGITAALSAARTVFTDHDIFVHMKSTAVHDGPYAMRVV